MAKEESSNRNPVAIIPKNLKGTNNVYDLVPLRSLVEGVVTGISVYFIMRLIPFPGSIKTPITVVFVIILSILAIMGRRGDTTSQLIIKMIKFRKNKRTAVYERSFYVKKDDT